MEGALRWRWYAVVVVICASGLGFIWGSFRLPDYPILARLLETAGVAFISASIVALTIDEALRCKTVGELVHRFTLLVAARASHIEMIYPDRANSLHAMAEAIDEAAEFVCVMGIALRDFLGEVRHPVCTSALYEAACERRRNVRILILDNHSADALVRSKLEDKKNYSDDDHKQSRLWLETTGSMGYVRDNYPAANPDGTEVLKVYDQQSVFLLITDKVAFSMPYHWGDRRHDHGHAKSTLGQFDPIVKFGKAYGGMYWKLLEHFNYVYEHAHPPSPATRGQAAARRASASDASAGETVH